MCRWSLERRLAQAELMRKLNQDPEFQRRRDAGLRYKRDWSAQAEFMRKLNQDPEFNRRKAAGHRNLRLSLETRQKIAEAVAKAHERGDYFRGPTSLELALRRLLCGAGFEFEEQVRMGRFVVDAFVPSHSLVFEADGSFWSHHKDKKREAMRDAYLLNRGVTAVIHLTEKDLTPFRMT